MFNHMLMGLCYIILYVMVLHVAIININMVKKQNWFIITHTHTHYFMMYFNNIIDFLCVMSLCDDLVKCVCVCVCVCVCFLSLF